MIGQHTIDRVRQGTALVELIGETVRLQKRGRSYVGLCPFHKEKTPSFHVSEERGLFHCFGCGKSGDAIQFLEQSAGMSFVEAVRALAERAGIEVEESLDEASRKQQAELRRRRQELYEATEAAAQFFDRMLREHPLRRHAQAELERRALWPGANSGASAEALQAFRIGYAPYGWESLCSWLRTTGVSLQAAERVGLVAQRRSGGGYYDSFRHRLMFAVIDLRGRVVGFSGRALEEPSEPELRELKLQPMSSKSAPAAGDGNSAERLAPKYVNSSESPIYKKREIVFGLYQARQQLSAGAECVLVEGNFDVVSLHAHAMKNTVAPLGTAFTLEQAKQLKRFTPNITLLFDGDDAGRRAVRAARDVCRDAGLLAKVASLPQGTDPDEFCRRRGADAVGRLIGAAQGLLEYLIDSALETGTGDGGAQSLATKVREVTELLKSENDPAVQALAEQHADAVVARLGVADARSFRELAASVRLALSKGGAPPPGAGVAAARTEPPARARSPDRRPDIAPEIVGALLDYPELIDSPEMVEGAALIEGDLAAVIAALRQATTIEASLLSEQILAKLPPSIHAFALARLAAPRHARREDAMAELLANVKKLKQLELLRQESLAVRELQRVAKLGDFEQEAMLLREQMARARARHGLEER
ncbi:MAG TPA: CHC2 zinc finger domain-containing protein [Polyangiaceae bacterium]